MAASRTASRCLLPVSGVAAAWVLSNVRHPGCKAGRPVTLQTCGRNQRTRISSIHSIKKLFRCSEDRWVSSLSIRCETCPPTSFAERLRADTRMLLSRRRGAAAEGCSIPDALCDLQAQELVELFRYVEELVSAVDSLAEEWPSRSDDTPLPGVALAPVRAAYDQFLGTLGEVDKAIIGLQARPLTETGWWAPLLMRWRYYICSLYAWGLLPEAVVQQASQLLRELCISGIVDPLAGSGWHARLWQDAGDLGVVALDSYAVQPLAWAKVKVVADSREMACWGIDNSDALGIDRWALFLSWPPHSPETVGVDLLKNWPGRVLVYLGERSLADALGGHGDDGITGGRELLEELDAKWTPVRSWAIPQWPGYGDDMTVYVRK